MCMDTHTHPPVDWNSSSGQPFVPRGPEYEALNTVAGGAGIIHIFQTNNLSL